MKPTIPLITSRFIPAAGAGPHMANRLIHFKPEEPVPSFMDLFHKQILGDIQNERLKQIEDRLRKLGYLFENIVYLKEFLAEHATVVTYDDKPNYCELYLFHAQRHEVLAATRYETVRFEHNFNDTDHGYKMTVIAGEKP
jgi:hypothetical protein